MLAVATDTTTYRTQTPSIQRSLSSGGVHNGISCQSMADRRRAYMILRYPSDSSPS